MTNIIIVAAGAAVFALFILARREVSRYMATGSAVSKKARFMCQDHWKLTSTNGNPCSKCGWHITETQRLAFTEKSNGRTN